jgi:hypothetical protein
MQMLRDFFAEIQDLQMAMMPPPMPSTPQNQLAVPQPVPQSPLLPQGGGPSPSGGGGPLMMAEGGEVEDQRKNPNILEQAQTFMKENPIGRAIHYGAEAFKATSPMAWAAGESGNPQAEGSMLGNIAHVPAGGAQLAVDLPYGWTVAKGEIAGEKLRGFICSL